MLVNFDETGKVIWQNTYISKELAKECLADNTIWIDGDMPPLPPEKEGFVPILKVTPEKTLTYEFAPAPKPVYTETETIMQAITDLEILLFGMGGGKHD